MKLTGAAANRYFSKPEPGRSGLLIFGADAMRVALKRQEVIKALIGPQGEEEMRLTRMSGADLRSDKSLLLDAIKEQGFFPGPRVAFVEDATDGNAPAIKTALDDWQEGDAQIVVTAKQLNARSALRKVFEGHSNSYAAGIYDDPPSREEIETELKKANLQLDRDAMTDLTALSREIDPGDFRQTIEKLSLYMLGHDTPATSADLEACAPVSTEADLDDVLNAVAESRSGDIGPVMRKLESQGVLPVTLCIGATRHFRSLHMAASDPGGVSSGIAKMRPPIFGPRRDRMSRQAQKWGMRRLETALDILLDTDLTLRSSSQAPTMAVMERALIRLAMLGAR